MNRLHEWLKEGDPVASEAALADANVQRMRRAIVAASESRVRSFGDLARRSWAAATVVIALTVAVGMSKWLTPSPDARTANVVVPPAVSPEPGSRRQLQLIAPGGTRVIWIFNADFQP